MKHLPILIIIVFVVSCSSSRNSQSRVYDIVTTDNESYQLKGDTLFSSTGLKLYKGQKLVIGNPAGQDGYYRSIIYKTAIVPSIWGQDKRYDHAIENHVNVEKSREGVKRLLGAGSLVTIKEIGLWKNSKPNFYIVSLTSGSDVFVCDLQFALSLKEISLQ